MMSPNTMDKAKLVGGVALVGVGLVLFERWMTGDAKTAPVKGMAAGALAGAGASAVGFVAAGPVGAAAVGAIVCAFAEEIIADDPETLRREAVAATQDYFQVEEAVRRGRVSSSALGEAGNQMARARAAFKQADPDGYAQEFADESGFMPAFISRGERHDVNGERVGFMPAFVSLGRRRDTADQEVGFMPAFISRGERYDADGQRVGFVPVGLRAKARPRYILSGF